MSVFVDFEIIFYLGTRYNALRLSILSRIYPVPKPGLSFVTPFSLCLLRTMDERERAHNAVTVIQAML